MDKNLDFGYVSHPDLNDPYFHTELIDDWEFSYNQVSAGKFRGSLNKIWFGDIEVYEEKLSNAVFQEGCCKHGILCLGIFRNFRDPTIYLGDKIENTDIININLNKEVFIKTPENSKFYALQIPFNLLTDHELIQLNDITSIVRNNKFNTKIFSKINYIFNALKDEIINDVAKQYIISEFLDIGCEYINLASKVPLEYKNSKNKAKQIIKEIINYLQSNQYILFTVEDLCKLTHTSRRTLHNYFEIIIGCSPSLFLKYWRLNATRRMLLNNKERMTISQIATYWGFWNFSQFTQDYKTLFGELPSQTLRYYK
ncbi:TPA: hypothetical protein JIY97_00555 [Acinetobacter baumannii]|nr:hypothetical protein [Acinetobacter baumannii]